MKIIKIAFTKLIKYIVSSIYRDCKHCKYSEVYKEKNYHTYIRNSPVYFTNRKCDEIYNTNSITPRLNNEDECTGVDHIDVDDNFSCIKFKPRNK